MVGGSDATGETDNNTYADKSVIYFKMQEEVAYRK